MTSITPTLLNDTLSLVQLARETALAKGKSDQASRLSPVVDDLRSLVSQSRDTQPAKTSPAPGGVMAQNDFRTLLAATAKTNPQSSNSSTSAGEHNQIVAAMASGGMSELDIARQMGITREEVQLILSIQRR